MSEETKAPESNDETWSGLKKTLIGTLSTAVLAGGTWLTTTLFGGHDSKEDHKTEQSAPAPAAAPVIVNLNNTNTNQQKQSGGTTTIIKEKEVVKEKPVEKKKDESKDAPW